MNRGMVYHVPGTRCILQLERWIGGSITANFQEARGGIASGAEPAHNSMVSMDGGAAVRVKMH